MKLRSFLLSQKEQVGSERLSAHRHHCHNFRAVKGMRKYVLQQNLRKDGFTETWSSSERLGSISEAKVDTQKTVLRERVFRRYRSFKVHYAVQKEKSRQDSPHL